MHSRFGYFYEVNTHIRIYLNIVHFNPLTNHLFVYLAIRGDVYHNIVVDRLVNRNFPTFLINWFSSYLSLRQQHVSLGSCDYYTSNFSSEFSLSNDWSLYLCRRDQDQRSRQG